MRLNSLRARMTLAFACAIATLLLLVCGWLAWYSRRVAEDEVRARLKDVASKVSEELREDGGRVILPKYAREKAAELRPDGLTVTLASAIDQNAPSVLRTTSDANWRVVTIPAGTDTIIVGYGWGKKERALRAQANDYICLSVLVTAAAALGAWLLVGRALAPIDVLTAEAQAASVESLSVHLTAPSPDREVVRLVATLNGLLGRLAEASTARGRFYAAASHELRTPLHTLSGHLEVGLSRKREAAQYRETMEEAYRQTQRLTALVQDLLLLTQLQNAASAPPQESVSLTEFCEESILFYTPLAAARRLQLRCALGQEMEILAPPTHIEMLTRNLIENAVKYAAEGGAVQIRLTALEAKTELDIFNECPPLPLQDINQLLEPFYRPDESRSSETGGNGLGLALCHAITLANHWSLRLRQEPDGFRVTVRF